MNTPELDGPSAQGSLSSLLARLPAGWRWGLLVWSIARFVLIGWGLVVWKLGLILPQAGQSYYYGISPVVDGWATRLAGIWLRWDGIHYLRIAQSGYSSVELSAFFPLYPLLAKSLTTITGLGYLGSLLVVSNIASLLVGVVIYRLAEGVFGQSAARWSVVWAAAYPGSFFFTAPYPQSLALLLVLLAFLCARSRQWLAAAACGLAAGLTHLSGLPLVALLAWEAVEQRKSRGLAAQVTVLLASLTPALGTGLFQAWRLARGFPPYGVLLRDLWGSVVQPPWQAVLDLPRFFSSPLFWISGWANLVVFLVTVATTVWALRHMPSGLRLYLLLMLLLFFSNRSGVEPLSGFTRHTVLAFPMFIAASIWLRSRWSRYFVLGASVALQLYLAGLFFMWVWVA